jgi:hypothetical protein
VTLQQALAEGGKNWKGLREVGTGSSFQSITAVTFFYDSVDRSLWTDLIFVCNGIQRWVG